MYSCLIVFTAILGEVHNLALGVSVSPTGGDVDTPFRHQPTSPSPYPIDLKTIPMPSPSTPLSPEKSRVVGRVYHE